ncbi:sulfotransferase [Marinobacter sp. SS13-12]|uniref:sulfotransferase n=1 Tax=Marinobacter sp. SS13-12 TaxID=3050451 RepID=UPI00255620DC|nr:sulfotransferase [Marinobacter sp. SS13-12]MDK8464261.1 sulfotransferase [Marinobacter sp. SS13-12]
MTLNVENKQNVLLYRAKRRGRHYLKLLYQRVNPSHETRPVFILGSGRSGTDIVSHCLSKAWDVELINEDNPKAFDNWRLKSLEAVKGAVNASNATLVLFKPIVESLRAEEFLKEFQSAAVVFVVRNPHDSINSMVRFFGEAQIRAVKSWVETDFARKTQAPAELREFIASHCHADLSVEDAAGLYWLLYNSSYLFLDLQSSPRVTKIRYESLVQEPYETIRETCDFLGVKWFPSMTEEVYAGSVGKNRKPDLSPAIEKRCSEVWERLTVEKYQNSTASSIV